MWLERQRPQGPAFNSSKHKAGLGHIGNGTDHQPEPVTGLSKQKSRKLSVEESEPRLGHPPYRPPPTSPCCVSSPDAVDAQRSCSISF